MTKSETTRAEANRSKHLDPAIAMINHSVAIAPAHLANDIGAKAEKMISYLRSMPDNDWSSMGDEVETKHVLGYVMRATR